VPELAKLLPDPQLSSWARIALEAIPGPVVDEALRTAAESLQGQQLVGAINSIGVRRDARAVDALSGRLQDPDAEVASAAAIALGRIGNEAAARVLRAAAAAAPATVRSAIAEGYLLCAERFLNDGKSTEAVEIYDEIRMAELPMQRIIEATRGAILARNADEGIPLLLEQFRSPDKKLFQLALSTAREFPGSQVDRALADELANATPPRAALIIQAMADRPETVVMETLLEAAARGDRQVRLSAIDALGRVGDEASLDVLLESALEPDADLARASREALARIPGEKVDRRIVELLRTAAGRIYPLLVELVGQRRIAATDLLIKAMNDSDPAVRRAALVALGETVSLRDLSVLIAEVLSPAHSDDSAVAQQALRAASVRMPDREACAAELTTAFQSAGSSTQGSILEILADVGGDTALKTIGDAAKSADPRLQDVGSRLLGKWNHVNAAPVLLDLANTAPDEKYRIRALRGFIGIARKFDMADQQRAEMCRQAFTMAGRLDEKKLVLEVLKLYPAKGTLDLAIEAMQLPELKVQATEATLEIARNLGEPQQDLETLLAGAGFEKVRLEIVKAQYGAGSTQKDVTAVIRKQAGELPFLTLPSPGYNASFGGDPLPGIAKQLTIWYRINDKDGKATFAENALIFLPSPQQ
jgi:HEAT repeat protein